MEWYGNDKKQQGSVIIQAEKVNGNCHYALERGRREAYLWMCGDSWWYGWWVGELIDKGQCKGKIQASTDSKPNVHVQDDTLQWKRVDNGNGINLKFNCVDVCL